MTSTRPIAIPAAALCVGLALGAFAQAPARPAPSPSPAPPAAGSISGGEKRFLERAAVGGMKEVELGRLAQERGMRDEIKSFANRMVIDHAAANDELAKIAGAKGMSLPAAPGRDHGKEMERLRKLVGPEFDRAYMKHMVDDHEKDVSEFRRQARSARDPDVQRFAAAKLPTLEDHLRAAKVTYDLTRPARREVGSRKK